MCVSGIARLHNVVLNAANLVSVYCGSILEDANVVNFVTGLDKSACTCREIVSVVNVHSVVLLVFCIKLFEIETACSVLCDNTGNCNLASLVCRRIGAELLNGDKCRRIVGVRGVFFAGVYVEVFCVSLVQCSHTGGTVTVLTGVGCISIAVLQNFNVEVTPIAVFIGLVPYPKEVTVVAIGVPNTGIGFQHDCVSVFQGFFCEVCGGFAPSFNFTCGFRCIDCKISCFEVTLGECFGVVYKEVSGITVDVSFYSCLNFEAFG